MDGFHVAFVASCRWRAPGDGPDVVCRPAGARRLAQGLAELTLSPIPHSLLVVTVSDHPIVADATDDAVPVRQAWLQAAS